MFHYWPGELTWRSRRCWCDEMARRVERWERGKGRKGRLGRTAIIPGSLDFRVIVKPAEKDLNMR